MLKINPYIFRNYDIRGIADVDLDAEKVEAIGKAYGIFLQRRKIRQAVIGRDCRLSGKKYQAAFIKGMKETGIDIIDLGLVMTQMVYYGQYRYQTNGGVMITASHNPAHYNGFKLAIGYSLTTGPEEVAEIKSIIDEAQYFYPVRAKISNRNHSSEAGRVIKKDIRQDYTKDILKRIELNPVRNGISNGIKKKFKVAIDSGNGVTGIYIPQILKQAGCKVIGKNLKVDGRFPLGAPDPTGIKMMNRLKETVLKEKADLGFAFDGDGDRLGAVDEKGNILWNDVLVAIFAKEILERFPGSKIVYNTLCSQIVKEVVKKNGGIPIIWKTGHSFIKTKIAEEKAVFGGELSGHFFFADNFYGHDDGTYAALRLLEYLGESEQSLSELYQSFPKYISSPEIKLGCPDDQKAKVVRDIAPQFKNDFPEAEITDETIIPGDDGVRADFENGMMIFRYSQNGPYITVKFEAKDQQTYNERKKYVKKTLLKYPVISWQDELAINLEALE